jgi:hypothetical protein
LEPEDIDWEKSRPLKPWPTGDGRLYFDYERRPIYDLELRREDVLTTFGEYEPKRSAEKLNDRKRDAVNDAIAAIGSAVLAGKLQKEREATIIDWVKQRRSLDVSERFIRKIWLKARIVE